MNEETLAKIQEWLEDFTWYEEWEGTKGFHYEEFNKFLETLINK